MAKPLRKARTTERLFLIALSVVLGLLFTNLYSVLQRDFREVPRRLAEGTIVNLNAPDPGKNLTALLQKGYFFEDPRDISLVTTAVNSGLGMNDALIDNIGELNKSKYNVAASAAATLGGQSFQRRAALSRSLLGFTGPDSNRFNAEVSRPPALPYNNNLSLGAYTIDGIVVGMNGVGAGGVLVRLQLLIPEDSLYTDAVVEVAQVKINETAALRTVFASDTAGQQQLQSLAAYARTDPQGRYSFTGLPKGKAFEILPLQPNFQFGASRGIADLSDNITFNFTARTH
ncbi:MAG: cell cycle protein, partial [Chitinophagaceae bacterium]